MDIADYYKALPTFTRYYLTGTIVLAALATFHIVDAYALALFPEQATWGLQVWRFATSFLFFGEFSFMFLMGLFHIAFSVRGCETSFADDEKHDFWWMLAFLLPSITVSLLFDARRASRGFGTDTSSWARSSPSRWSGCTLRRVRERTRPRSGDSPLPVSSQISSPTSSHLPVGPAYFQPPPRQLHRIRPHRPRLWPFVPLSHLRAPKTTRRTLALDTSLVCQICVPSPTESRATPSLAARERRSSTQSWGRRRRWRSSPPLHRPRRPLGGQLSSRNFLNLIQHT